MMNSSFLDLLHFRKTCIASLFTALLLSSTSQIALAQSAYQDPGKIGDAASWRTSEYKADWGLEAMHAAAAYAAGYTGKGIKVGVLDSGLDTNHQEFKSSRIHTLETIGTYGTTFDHVPKSFHAETGNYITHKAGERFDYKGSVPNDDHGTHVSGSIAASRDGSGMHGVAFDSDLYMANTRGTDELFNDAVLDYNYYYAAYKGLADTGTHIINNSWGSTPSREHYDTLQQFKDNYALYFDHKSYIDAAAEVAKLGVIQVWANGNDPNKNPWVGAAWAYYHPEIEPYWLTVQVGTKATNGLGVANWSNQCGVAKYWCVNAPGTDIKSSIRGGNYATWDGSSMSAPHASGALAIVMQRFPYLSATEARDVLMTTAKDLGVAGVDDVYGWGLIDLSKAINGPGQFLGKFDAALPGGVTDVWSNDISEAALIQRQGEDAAEQAAWQKTLKEKGWDVRPPTASSNKQDQAAYLLGTTRALAAAMRTYRGSLVKGGDGRLILAGNNTYSGGTTILGGVLQVGNGGTSGSIVGDVVDNAVLAFNRSDTTTFGGAVSGTGILVQAGTGTLTLSGANTYTGGTAITDGTLAATGGQALPDAGTVAIAKTGRLKLLSDETIGGLSGAGSVDLGASRLSTGADGSSSTYGGTIGGTGGLTKLGKGSLNLTGASDYSGETVVESGLLSVNGALASGVDVLSGGRLGGNGQIAALDVAAGGTLAPGNSVGTLHVAGDAHLAPNSRYEVEVAQDGRMDALAVGGMAYLGGVQVNLLKENTGRRLTSPEFRSLLGSRFDIVQAAGGVSGTFAPIVDTDFTFMSAALGYSPNAVNLTLERNAVAFSDMAASGNGAAAAAAVDGMTPGTPLFEMVLANNDPAALAPLFDSLDGEVHADMATALLENSRFIRSQALERAGAGADGAPSGDTVRLAGDAAGATVAYLRGIGNWGSADGRDNNADADRHTGGTLFGIDGTLDGTWRIGALAGYSNTSLNLGGAQGSGSADAYEVGLYAGRRFDNGIGVRAGATYLHTEIDTTRSIAGLGRAKADYGADGGQAFAEAGWRLGDEQRSVEPFVNLAYVGLHTNAFHEDANIAGLTSGGFGNDALFSTLGVHLETTLALADTAVTAKGTLGWRHAYGDTTPDADLAFAAGGPPFAAQGTPIARDALVLEAGAGFAITPDLSLDVAYQGQFAKDTIDNGVKAGLSWKF